jgi:hypothetical protein
MGFEGRRELGGTDRATMSKGDLPRDFWNLRGFGRPADPPGILRSAYKGYNAPDGDFNST